MASRQIALVSYASPDLVPSGLKRVAVVSGTAPNSVQRVSPVVLASPDLAPAGLKLYGAISYASLDLVPSGLQALALDDYLSRVLATGPIAYWPFDEAAGSTIVDRSGNARNGAYTAVTLGAAGVGDGRTAASFDGTTSFGNIYSAGLAGAFNGAEGTALAWCKVSAVAVWTDVVFRKVLNLRANASNRYSIYKDSTANRFVFEHIAGGTPVLRNIDGVSWTNWVCLALTWSQVADQCIAYVNGIQQGATLTTIGVWTGPIATALVGADTITPTQVWSGMIGHVALFSRALSSAEIASLSVL